MLPFAGELGWELYVRTEFAVGLFDEIMAAGRQHDLKLVGLHAVDSLRLEKGYRHWGSDIGPLDTPLEAGLGFAVNFDKGDFLGREALLKQKEQGLKRRLVMFTIDDPEPLLYHDEPVYRNGRMVAANTHGAYAHMVNASMGIFYLENPEGVTSNEPEVFERGTTDFKIFLVKLKKAGVDLVFYAGSASEGAMILKQASEMGLTNNVKFIGSEEMGEMELLSLAGQEAVEGTYAVSLWGEVPADFAKTVKERFDAPMHYAPSSSGTTPCIQLLRP